MNRKVQAILGLAGLLALGLASLAAADGWYDNLKVFGDVRFREEMIQDEILDGQAGKDQDRDRQRIRARLGVQAPVDDYWKATLRLATDDFSSLTDTQGSPISRNETLSGGETPKPIWLDEAFIEYKAIFNILKLTAGKMGLPMEIVGGNKLIFKDDLTPEGIYGNFVLNLADSASVFVNGGGFWIREVSSSYDPMLYNAQVGTKMKLDDLKFTVGVGENYCTDLTKQFPIDFATAAPTVAAPGSGYGNSLNPRTGTYADNYYIAQAFAELTYPIFDLPFKIYSDNAINNGATHFQKAYIVGLVINKASTQGTWEVGYNWRLSEKNSVLGAFNDDDFAGGGVNNKGSVITAAYVPADGVKTVLTFFRSQKNLDQAVNPWYNRFQADVQLSF